MIYLDKNEKTLGSAGLGVRPHIEEIKKTEKGRAPGALKEEMSLLCNEYTNNSRFVVSPNTNLIKRHFPVSVREWDNSVYMYNPKTTILFSAIDRMVIKLVKSYFNANFMLNKKRKFRFSVLNKIYVSKPEIKHTNSEVIITIYRYSSSINENSNKIEISNWKKNHISELAPGYEYKDYTVLDSNDINYNDINNEVQNNEKKFNLSHLISLFYNKKVYFRIIDLKYLHLNTSILVEYLANKLTNRQKILRKYRKILRKIKLPVYNKYRHNNNIDNDLLKKLSLNNLSNISVKKISSKNFVKKNLLINKILTLTKYKALVGVRFEIAGRLTRRNVASKSVFKVGQKGTLKNIDSSYKRFSVVNLRGHVRPNIDYSTFATKTRNGQFNVKGWTSCYYSTSSISLP